MRQTRKCFAEALLAVLFCSPVSSAWAGGEPPSIDAISDQEITPAIQESGKSAKTFGSPVLVTVEASDPENDSLYFFVDSVTKAGNEVPPSEYSQLRLSINDESGLFSWNVSPSQVGEYTITVGVKDCLPSDDQATCGGTDTTTFSISVRKPSLCTGSDSACTFLKANESEGGSGVAGHLGDFYLAGDYENDTRYHAAISVGRFPQLDFMDRLKGSDFSIHPTYSSRGYNNRTFSGRPVISNSSTAYTSGPYWGGHYRRNCLSDSGPRSTYDQYTLNTHVWYPEHRDHDDKDHAHAKTPYCSSSQGSSGSEIDEIYKFVRTLAAFKKSVKSILREEGLLIPVLQMIFRRTRVSNDAEYLSGKAHPTAFDNVGNDTAMVQMAYGINPDNIPPFVQLDLVDDGSGTPGIHYPSTASEVYFETPASISLMFRRREYTKRIVVSARESFDLNSRPLTYHWAALRGAEKITINPLTEDNAVVEILLDYHPETTIKDSARLTNLIEVGAFVHNGEYYSAPGFITSFSFNNEERTYENELLKEIRYNDNYVMPRLNDKPEWERDVFQYEENTLLGWQRYQDGQLVKTFDANGHCSDCTTSSVSGSVNFEGKGLANVTVEASIIGTHHSEAPHFVTTDTDGDFTFPDLPDGFFRLSLVDLPTEYRILRSSSANISGSDIEDVVLEAGCAIGFASQEGNCVPQRAVSGRITFGGKSLSGITVEAQLVNSPITLSTQTDSDGFYVLGLSGNGDYVVTPKEYQYDFRTKNWSQPAQVTNERQIVENLDFAAVCFAGVLSGPCLGAGDVPVAPSGLRIVPLEN